METPYHAADGADALILATEWEAYRLLNLQELVGRMSTPILVDARNMFNPEDARMAGFTYFGVGR
jgi:UDPglucose 6-dehydrogenase